VGLVAAAGVTAFAVVVYVVLAALLLGVVGR
jgi:hypothetical protein